MKRTKFVAGLLSCMICLAMLTIGVWAVASVATLDINGNLKFYPEGLFVQLSGEIYRGNSSTESEMTKLSDPRFTYGPVANFDNIQDELSGNFPLEAWEIGNVAFIPNQRYIKIKVYITNYSDFAITGTPTVTIGGQDISETITGLTITSNTDELSSIASNTTATYELILEATGNTEFSKSLNVSFEFEEYLYINYDYFTYSSDFTTITGLSDTYKNLETKPETLVIPSKAPNGTPITTIESSSSTSNASNYRFKQFEAITMAGDPKPPDNNSVLKGLESSIVIIQNGISVIGGYAFLKCTSLTSIKIPSSVISISYMAFNGCSNLTQIEMPENLEYIGRYAFSGTGLTKITIPKSVINIGYYAFSASLKSAIFEDPNGWETDTTYSEISSEAIKDPETAATFLTSTYAGQDWNKVA